MVLHTINLVLLFFPFSIFIIDVAINIINVNISIKYNICGNFSNNGNVDILHHIVSYLFARQTKHY